MALRRVCGRGSLVGLAAVAAWSIGMVFRSVSAQEPPPDPAPAAAEGADPQGGQVLTQGPVHEAFATPVVHDPKAGPVLSKQPPAPIQEMPPDQKPAGQNVQWIPGYWAWDTSRNDYLWVSGIWREPPPGTQWVPGYWNPVEGGYQWVPGSWMPAGAGAGSASGPNQATYLPSPPASLEAGPNIPPPSPNVAWTPGYWSWQQGGYVWRPGFWAAVQPNWIWMPAHYVWTPAGYLFVPGYWDLPLANRGLLFAPVYYPQPVYAQPGFVFAPSISLVGSAVTANLFVQASTNQYLFGNFYAQNYVSVGIVPWFSFTIATGRPVYYDPLFSYYAVVNVRQNPQWVAQVRQAYVLRRDNVAMRPPGTYVEQTRIIERNLTINRDITVVDHRTIAMPLHRLAADPIAGRNLKLVRIHEAERQQLRQQAAQLHEFREQRLQQERVAARSGPAARPRTVSLPHSPIAAHHAAGHPGGTASHAAAAHHPEGSHPQQRPGASHPALAHRPEGLSRPAGARPVERGIAPRAGAPRARTAAPNRARPQPRPGTARPDPRRAPRDREEAPR
ncbi:MAG TPA: hypothetical protein VFF52_15415 [Isosphaeraceae bacterium]|nr:hypothetical protein [Isosphaeraceae bacterium]